MDIDVSWGDFLPVTHKDVLEDRLGIIFSLISHLGVSYSELLSFLFSSPCPKVRNRAGQFMAYHSNRAVPFAAKNIYDLWHTFPTAVPHLHRELVTPCAHEITLAESNTLIADKTLRINVSKCTLQKLRDVLDPFQLVLMTFAAAPTKSMKQAARKRTSMKPDETEDFLADSEDRNAEEDLEQEAQAEHASSFESFEGWAGEFPFFNTKCLITIVVIYSMLLYVRNRGINVLALPLALFLRLGGADRRLVTVLNHIGLSASYQTVERLKEVISNDAVQLAVAWMASDKAWFIIFDNINIYLRKFDQRLTNKNTMLNITNAAIIGLPDVLPAAFDLKKMNALWGNRSKAKGEDIEITLEDSEVMEKAMTAIVSQMLTAYCPGSKKWPGHSTTRQEVCKLMPFVRPLPPHKTDTFPFGIFDINEGSKKGTLEMMQALQEKSKKTPEEWASQVRITEGDWLTVNNLRGAKRERFDDVSVYDKLEYVKEISAKWHFGLNYLHLLIKVHLGNAIDDPGSLASQKGLLGRVWDVNKPNYAAAKSLVRHSLIARILCIVMQLNGFRNFSELQQWKPTFKDVHEISVCLVKEYATSTAGSKAKQADDDWLAHSIFFIRDALLFMIFEQYVSYADAGGILREYKFWLYSFRGAGMTNYARECLEVIMLWKFELTPELQDALEKAWFVNRSGQPGRFIAADLYLEHNNFWVKRGYIAQGSGVSVDYASKRGSACIEAFRDVVRKVVRFTGNTDVPRKHKETKFYMDLRTLVDNMNKKQLHTLSDARRFVPAMGGKRKDGAPGKERSAIVDVMVLGADSLQSGGFDDFMKQTTFDPAVGWPLEGSIASTPDVFATGTVFDRDENPISTDEELDVAVGEEEPLCPGAGALGGGTEFD